MAATKKQQERDLVILRLADLEPHERHSHYQDIVEVYGDEDLFKIACSLRKRGLIGWGSNWIQCWLTPKGDRAIQRSLRSAA
jgi:hypothetical protein